METTHSDRPNSLVLHYDLRLREIEPNWADCEVVVSEATEHQIVLLQHALGIQKKGKKWSAPYRNYFNAGEKDVADRRELVRLKLAIEAYTNSHFPGAWFAATEAGRALAIARAVASGAKFPKTKRQS